MMKIGIFIKDNDEKALEEAKNFILWALKKKLNIVLLKEHAKLIGKNNLGVKNPECFLEANFLLAFGGDGTMLRSARTFAKFGLPIFGVNLGRRGFLTEARSTELKKVIPKILSGSYFTDERMMLNFQIIRAGKNIFSSLALNDIVIGKDGIARIIRMEAFIEDQPATNYAADGLIISTPTGSTGHNLSAEGPIIDPKLSAIILTAICSLSISNRSIVIGGNEKLRILISEVPKGISVLLTSDGQQTYPLAKGDEILITKAPFTTKFLRLNQNQFYSILKEKLGWKG